MPVTSTSGQGRPKGVPNKVTADVKLLARQHGPAVIERLFFLAFNAQAEAAQIAAGKELLDRGYGKSVQPQSGPDGESNPIIEVTYRWADAPKPE
jgi:hypothetical protein